MSNPPTSGSPTAARPCSWTSTSTVCSPGQTSAAPEAVAHLEERLAETTGAETATLLRGWKNYFGAQRVEAQADAPPSTPPSIKPVLLPEEMERFLQLFGGREDVYARQSAEAGKGRFLPCAGALNADLVTAHLQGVETLATYLIRADGNVRHLVLDIDHADARGSKAGNKRNNKTAPDLTAVIAFAARLLQVCRDYGVPAGLEDSGRRGRHLWLFFADPVPPEAARRLGRLLAVQAGFPCPGVRLEILPRHTEWPGPELGDAVKLPFGVHPLSGRRCFLLDSEGQPIPDVSAALAQIRALDAARVAAITTALASGGAGKTQPATAKKDATSAAVAQLVDGCSVVRALVERARQTGHLRHTHQLILLYTAGHLGAEGAAFIHRVISLCRNYDAAICQGYIDRLDAKHPPVGCRRIREWLEEEGETGLCTCPSNRRTPLELIPERDAKPSARKAPQKPAPRALPLDNDADAWSDVAKDMFE